MSWLVAFGIFAYCVVGLLVGCRIYQTEGGSRNNMADLAGFVCGALWPLVGVIFVVGFVFKLAMEVTKPKGS